MKGLHNFKVYVKTDSDIDYVQVRTAIFPFKFGMMLDERLDEAYITILGTKTKTYKPTTRVKIELIENAHESDEEIVAVKHYIVASDTAKEMPVGSGFYKHELYLIEPTKLLEGIVCESLTFTNALGNIAIVESTTKTSAFTYFSAKINNQDISSGLQNEMKDLVENLYSSPETSSVLIMSPYNVASLVKPVLDEVASSNNSTLMDIPSTAIVNIYKKDVLQESATDGESPIITIDNTTKIEYNIVFRESVSGGVTPNDYSVNIRYTIEHLNVQYPAKRYTLADVVDRVLDLAVPLRVGETPKYTLEAGQHTEFNRIMSPEVTMTKNTLREQLKTVGGYAHAEARLGYTNPNNPTEYQENTIYFDKYGDAEESNIPSGYIEKTVSHSLNEYCTEIRTSAENIVNSLDYARGTLMYPNAYAFTNERTDNTNVRVEEDNAFLPTIDAIQEIIELRVTKYGGSEKDLTPFLYEKSKYDTLSSYEGTYPYTKSYALYYTQGSPNIDGLFFKAQTQQGAVASYLNTYAIANILESVYGDEISNFDGDINTLMSQFGFRITYKPISSSDYSHGKQAYSGRETEFTKIYNQSENLIEMQYFGEHIKGVSARLGNVEETRTYYLPSIKNVPKTGTILDDMYISAISCEWLPFALKCTIALSKDFNRRSQYIGINSNKRVSQVSERETYDRSRVFKNYCVFSRNGNLPLAQNPIFRDVECVARALTSVPDETAFPTSFERITTAFAWRSNADSSKAGEVMLPVMASTFGNVLELRWKYKDNYSAGDSVQFVNNGTVSGYWQTAVPYGDYFGRLKNYNFALIDRKETDGNVPQLDFNANSLPSVDVDTSNNARNINASGISTQNLPSLLRKDSRERILCGVSVEFKADSNTASDLIIGSALPKLLSIVTGQDTQIELVFLLDKIDKFRKELTVAETISLRGSVEASKSPDGTRYIIRPVNSEGADLTNFKAWAIMTPITYTGMVVTNEDGEIENQRYTQGGEILLASNDINTIGEDIYINMAEIYK